MLARPIWPPLIYLFTGPMHESLVSAHALTAAICAVGLHRRVLLLRLSCVRLSCSALVLPSMPVRSELIAHVLRQQAKRPQLVLLIATTIVYRCDPSGFSRNLTTRLPCSHCALARVAL